MATEQEYFDDLDSSDGRIGEWQECHYCCGTGFSHHDCGDDTCCCLEPEDNVTCDTCMGIGGWYIEVV